MKALLSNTLLAVLFLVGGPPDLTAQFPNPTSVEERMEGYSKRAALKKRSLLTKLPFTNVGPSVFSGRVVDIAVNPQDPSIFYVAYASGGLWKTENNGISFSPLFDQEIVMTIGDIAVDWQRGVIWVGTGENNSSRSSYAGFGMYRSDDDGISWQHKGLSDSHHTGRIILHPTDPDILWVAMTGHLYSNNDARGIYRSEDGGDSWQKTLYVDDKTGAIDIIQDPANPNMLFAAMWERSRKAWDFQEAGPGTGIYKSIDGGLTWTKISGGQSGFPDGEGAGRIGLAMTRKDGRSYLYAILDNYYRRPPEEEKSAGLSKDMLREMTTAQFLELEDKELRKFLKENRFPKEYSADRVKSMVKYKTLQPVELVEYLEDANSLLFDTPVIGAEVYLSTDEGATWAKTHEDYLDRVYNSYGYYFGQIRIDPNDPEKVYIMGVPIIKSSDGGKTWENINQDNVHVDHHALWINPQRQGHLILGNDGGINISYDDGKTWSKNNEPAVGQFYAIAVDRQDPYHIYGGTQDNGVWEGPSNYEAGVEWQSSGAYPYEELLGGDGMQVEVDWRTNDIVYTGYQFGNYFRIHKKDGSRKSISPKHELGQRPFRFNWQTPILLSRHNQDILYLGSHMLHRSMNQGNDWAAISGDLTQGGKTGDVAYGTLTSISESPFQFGLLYTGSDDGRVHVTEDSGSEWSDISAGLPSNMWVSRVMASSHVKDRVYCSLNGYRWDDFEAYLFVSEDKGQSWLSIGDDLPHEPVNVVKEDPVNQNVLYVGTDHGVYISMDRGSTFMSTGSDLPAVAVHDLVVHPDAKELVLGTHGRSIYTADVSQIQQLDDTIMKKSVHLFSLAKVRYRSNWGQERLYRDHEYVESEVSIPVYLKDESKLTIAIELNDTELSSWEERGVKGLNFFTYDLSFDKKFADTVLAKAVEKDEDFEWPDTDNKKIYLPPGDYTVKISLSSAVESTVTLKVE